MVLQDNPSDLLHLIRFCVRAIPLQIDPLIDASASKNEVTSARSLRKPKPQENSAEFIEPDTRVGSSAKNLIERFIAARHRKSVARR
jgi:hypothetical protein